MLELLTALVLSAPITSAQGAGETFRLDCRYTRPASEPQEPARTTFLPDDELFSPPLADSREPRMMLGLRRERWIGLPLAVTATDETFTAGFVGAGGHFGFLGRRRPGGCNGFQLGIFGGADAQFNLDAARRDLIATDFQVGAQLSARKGGLSVRLRVYHLSSHVGDEFLLHNPRIIPKEFGYESFDALVSLDGAAWRAYAGGGFIDFAFGDPDTAVAQAGFEMRKRRDDGGFRPVAAVDVTAMDEREWGLTTTTQAGFEWTSPAAVRRLRALVVFVNGYAPHGQYILQQRARGIGISGQFDF